MASSMQVRIHLHDTVRGFGKRFVPVAQIGALAALGLALARLVAAGHVVVPASGIGILLLFGLFACGLARPECLEPGATLLARHLGVFFVPILAGAAFAWHVPAHVLLPVFSTLAISASCALLTTGLVFEFGVRRKNR